MKIEEVIEAENEILIKRRDKLNELEIAAQKNIEEEAAKLLEIYKKAANQLGLEKTASEQPYDDKKVAMLFGIAATPLEIYSAAASQLEIYKEAAKQFEIAAEQLELDKEAAKSLEIYKEAAEQLKIAAKPLEIYKEAAEPLKIYNKATEEPVEIYKEATKQVELEQKAAEPLKIFEEAPKQLKIAAKQLKIYKEAAKQFEVLNKKAEPLKILRDAVEPLVDDKFGIAFSGGGIRSASICLGLTKVLAEAGILKKADYISSVSGGGYTNAYIQAALKEGGSFENLVDKPFLKGMRDQGGRYLSFGGPDSPMTTLLLIFNVITTFIIGLINPLILFSIIAITGFFILDFSRPYLMELSDAFNEAVISLAGVAATVWSLSMIAYYFFKIRLTSFQKMNLVVIVVFILGLFFHALASWDAWLEALRSFFAMDKAYLLLLLLGLILLGFFANINSISFGRLYGDSLARAFFDFNKSILLKDLYNPESEKENDYLAPYPLFNCCLNIPGKSEIGLLSGADYFLLSPKFCGSERSAYIPTDEIRVYNELSLARAMTTSAAALNSAMGNFSSAAASIVIGMLNLRQGALLPNPKAADERDFKYIWWPLYYLRALFSNNSLEKSILDISDGGHIENLAVFELLRRKCRLIIGVDAGMDAAFGFADLHNLMRRSLNELGLEIRFRPGHDPFTEIAPNQSGFSTRRHCIADVHKIWEEILVTDDEGKIIFDTRNNEIRLIPDYFLIRNEFVNLEPARQNFLDFLLKEVNLWDLLIKPQEEATQEILDILPLRMLQYNAKTNGNELPVPVPEQSLKDIQSSLDLTDGKYANTLNKGLEFLINMKSILLEEMGDNDMTTEDQEKKIKPTIDRISRQMFKLREGIYVYIKSSINASGITPNIHQVKNSLADKSYNYTRYNYKFPHQSTADQFFDPIQFQAYYELGRSLAGEVLNRDPDDISVDGKLSHRSLINFFTDGTESYEE